MIPVLLFLCVIVLAVYLLLKVHPVFGQKPSQSKVQASPQYSNGSFKNTVPTSMSTDWKTSFTMIRDMFNKNANRKPKSAFPVTEFPTLSHPHHKTNITWFGHSASMIEIDGKHLFLDPMFGEAPSPFPWMGGKRYSRTLPFTIEKLPIIDAVIFSHDHYDHLDYGTIQKLSDRVRQFFVPIGVGSHLERWGISTDKIIELDWWEEVEFHGITLAAAPARHFSGRSLHDRNSTLWCSWVIKGQDSNIFFSGDSGYGPHFKEIGERYGPFDLTLMECGQYDPRWAPIHMLPEETVQAHLDVKGTLLLPIHWGAFTLSFHEWTDPVRRVTKAGEKEGISILTPMIGETVVLNEPPYPERRWWEE
ncbi:MBL fold metallo-hydrolase [Rossellomorea sp. NS-SX7]|uniref:MBL fold metallo-hydrolase n=1 Tax=Rossellomorea sp. NS-SX7 TaxID=3463856 RepID=UPI0040588E75